MQNKSKINALKNPIVRLSILHTKSEKLQNSLISKDQTWWRLHLLLLWRYARPSASSNASIVLAFITEKKIAKFMRKTCVLEPKTFALVVSFFFFLFFFSEIIIQT